jgi:hypothetical protein
VTKLDATILPLTTSAPVASVTLTPAPSATEILIYAQSLTVASGSWSLIPDATAANGTAVGNPDAGAAKLTAPLAAPVNYVEFVFNAEAGRLYRLWIRGRAERDSWANDSVFVQFTGSGSSNMAVARIGSTDAYVVNLEDAANAGLSGWGWQDNGYGAGVLGPLVQFDTTGPHTMRIQTREDGVRLDQIVLSAQQYLTASPGALKNDSTILR